MAGTYDDMIARAIADREFRTRLLAHPEATLLAEGYEVSPDVVARIKGIDPAAVEAAVKEVEAQFGDQKAAA